MKNERGPVEYSTSQRRSIEAKINSLFTDPSKQLIAKGIVFALDPLLSSGSGEIKPKAKQYMIGSYTITKRKNGNHMQMEVARLMPVSIAENDGEKDPRVLIINYNPDSKKVEDIYYKNRTKRVPWASRLFRRQKAAAR